METRSVEIQQALEALNKISEEPALKELKKIEDKYGYHVVHDLIAERKRRQMDFDCEVWKRVGPDV